MKPATKLSRDEPRCPYCATEVEPDLACAGCGATAQDRMTWVMLVDLRLLRPGTTMLHHLPSAPMARRLYALLGSGYNATLPPGTAPVVPGVPFQVFDPASEAAYIAAGRYDLVIVGSGLLDTGAALPSVLEALTKALAPGGSLLFGGDALTEDGSIASPALRDLIASDRGEKNSFARLVRRQFKRDCRVRPGDELDATAFEAAGLRIATGRRISPVALFRYQA